VDALSSFNPIRVSKVIFVKSVRYRVEEKVCGGCVTFFVV
jgi:hypothetical protein